jgi:hypothetical protein
LTFYESKNEDIDSKCIRSNGARSSNQLHRGLCRGSRRRELISIETTAATDLSQFLARRDPPEGLFSVFDGDGWQGSIQLVDHTGFVASRNFSVVYRPDLRDANTSRHFYIYGTSDGFLFTREFGNRGPEHSRTRLGSSSADYYVLFVEWTGQCCLLSIFNSEWWNLAV